MAGRKSDSSPVPAVAILPDAVALKQRAPINANMDEKIWVLKMDDITGYLSFTHQSGARFQKSSDLFSPQCFGRTDSRRFTGG